LRIYYVHTSKEIGQMQIKPAHCALVAGTSLALGLWSALPTAADAASASGDACSLFTATQVGAALGVAVTEGQHVIPTSSLLCGWAPATGAQIGGKKLTVNLLTERSFELGKVPVQGIPKTALGGVGDEAYYITTGGFGTALSVKKGGAYVQIRVGGFPDDKAKEVEKALALQALSKL
jgi:hypothetical protein